MRARLFAAAKYVLYPLFYLVCLLSFLYLTFPWDKLKSRMEAEFNKAQEKKGERAWRLEIDEVSGYWLSGIRVEGARIIMPPEPEADEEATRAAPSGALGKVTSAARANKKKAQEEAAAETSDAASGDEAPEKDAEKKAVPKDIVVLITEAHARARILPLLIGKVRVDFEASVFNGAIRGTIPFGGGELLVEVENLDLGQVAPLKDVVSVPLRGTANGKLELAAEDGKWSKAAGEFNLTVTNMIIGDGKSKFRKLGVTMTPATVGTFEIIAKAESGTFKFEKFGATGQEVELAGEGSLKLKDPWDNSVLDLWLRFGFADEYKHKDDRTTALFVDDGPFPALISQDRKLKKALRADGLWGFNIKGKLSRLNYVPTKADGPKGKGSSSGDGPTTNKKKKGEDDEEETPSSSDAATPSSPSAAATPTFKRPPAIKTPGARVPTRNSKIDDPALTAQDGPEPAGEPQPQEVVEDPQPSDPADTRAPDGQAEPPAPEPGGEDPTQPPQ